ncbi:predicted protein [Aspergillus nidulans FGSC A4]|uniref:Uncharacterized protein n=1 Tax=Emericella nidulans (strain FGSC A4 / ATCC 38163 / CBS 112.46 / NRRL 194 / M139) TaxID=227321 RepID=Q5AXI5_EMENI|nr:hypothetical protein [Aspergillus nidulans FGSC A4]EAA61641.1 predicted protein [Aspergillus nidulans FGSC A4]CBF79294.1 TPA: conserved hypothetical protein [Aspergillus nidulans FGSC A4]|eukprot:XP_664599.1 predicted protein [Aspergillus nidulans FGSC A4]
MDKQSKRTEQNAGNRRAKVSTSFQSGQRMLIQGNIASKGLLMEVFRPQTSHTEGLEWLFSMVDGTRLIRCRNPAISPTAVMDQKCTARKELRRTKILARVLANGRPELNNIILFYVISI